MTFHRITEDPYYDEEGQYIDEDLNWQDLEDLDEDFLNERLEKFSPFETINS